MVCRHVPLKVEAIERRLLRHRPLAHHRHFKREFFNRIASIADIKNVVRWAEKNPVSGRADGVKICGQSWTRRQVDQLRTHFRCG
jgi:dienelactone hydrolase